MNIPFVMTSAVEKFYALFNPRVFIHDFLLLCVLSVFTIGMCSTAQKRSPTHVYVETELKLTLLLNESVCIFAGIGSMSYFFGNFVYFNNIECNLSSEIQIVNVL